MIIRKHFMPFSLMLLCLPTLANASGLHRLAFSERIGVEYLAVKDSTGNWCHPELNLKVVARPKDFAKSTDFQTLTPRVGRLAEAECPGVQSASINVFEVDTDQPVWRGKATASQGWQPVMDQGTRSANLDECSARDLDCAKPASSGNTSSPAAAVSVHRVGPIGGVQPSARTNPHRAGESSASSKVTLTPPRAVPQVSAQLPPGFPRKKSANIVGPNFTGQDLSGKNLSKQKLDGAKFSGANLEQADLSGASLKQAVFDGSNLQRANLRGANLTEADLKGAIFPLYLSFSRAVFVGADFEGADLKGTDFWQSNLSGANLRNTRNFGQIGDANLSKTDLRGANLLNAVGSLKALNIKGAIYDDTSAFPLDVDPEKLGAIKVDGAQPPIQDFSGQDLSQQNLAYQLLNDANFSDSTLRSTRLEGSLLKRANFQNADLRNTNLNRADLSGADLRGATLPFTAVHGLNLSNAILEGLDLKQNYFYLTNLSGANLRNTKNFGNLFGANLTNADLRGANLLTAQINPNVIKLNGAKYDLDTVFPDGFKPEAHGMIRVD